MQYAYGPAHVIVTSLLLGLVTMATIVGNVFVMVAIGVERHLRMNVANYLIASLAVADLLVAALVMPLAAMNDVTHGWPLGRLLCDAWVSFDVLCCTASILHLVAISVDRYWAVTRVDYIHHRQARFTLHYIEVIMRPSSLGGGRILRRTLSVRLSVCLSVRPSRYRCHR